MAKKSKIKYIVIFSILIIAVFYYPVMKFVKKYQCINVENKVTRLYDLCYSTHAEMIVINNPMENIFYNEITGLSKDDAEKFGKGDIQPIVTIHLYSRSLMDTKMNSTLRPVLSFIELYKVDNEYYIKVCYTIDRYSGYSAVYKYSDISEDDINQVVEKKQRIDIDKDFESYRGITFTEIE